MSVEQLTRAGRRSALCVPASEERKIVKALGAGADEIVLDLEDAVAPADKDRAREVLTGIDWPKNHPRLAVRVNAPRTPWCHRDLEVVGGAGMPVSSIVLPKVESRADIGFAERLLDGVGAPQGLSVQALIETAGGVAGLAEIAADVDRLEGLVIGYADLAASLGRKQRAHPETWLTIQQAVLTAARSAGLQAIDGPHLGTEADDAFRRSCDHTSALGFDGKWVIHPRQVEAVNVAFAPSPRELTHARAVIAALDAGHAGGRGAVVLDGQLVDEAMAVAARRVLAKEQ